MVPVGVNRGGEMEPAENSSGILQTWPFPLYFSYHMKLQDEIIYGRGPQPDCTAGGEQWASETVHVWDDPSPPLPRSMEKIVWKKEKVGDC